MRPSVARLILSSNMDPVSAFNAHRPLLFGIAYRMLGSVADAEDVVQEAFVRWRNAGEAEVEAPKAYLATIVTRLCIDQMKSARARRESYVGPWLPEPLVGDPAPGADHLASLSESLSVAFLMLLETLSPVERAVFLLRDVFEFSYEQVAPIVGKSAVACRQIERRARARVHDGEKRFVPSAEERERLASGFMQAAMSGDLDGLLSMLAEDAALYADGGGKAARLGKVSALTRPIVGRERVAKVTIAALSQALDGFTWRVASINGTPGILGYIHGKLYSATALDIADGRVRGVYVVANPEKLSRFDPASG